MPPVHRLGDENTANGAVISIPQSTVHVNGLLVSVDGSGVEPHSPFLGLHDNPHTANGSSTVHCAGLPVNRLGDADDCGHTRAAGSPNVNIG